MFCSRHPSREVHHHRSSHAGEASWELLSSWCIMQYKIDLLGFHPQRNYTFTIYSVRYRMSDLSSHGSSAAKLLNSLSSNPSYCYAVLAILVVAYSLVQSLRLVLKPGLSSIPGPVFAKFSSLYRPWKLASGDAPGFYRELHRRYGKIVRTGPKTVDIADPTAVATIYGINTKFLKVKYRDLIKMIRTCD